MFISRTNTGVLGEKPQVRGRNLTKGTRQMNDSCHPFGYTRKIYKDVNLMGIMEETIKLIAVILSDGSVDLKRHTVSFVEDRKVVERLIQEFKVVNNIDLNWKVDMQKNSLRARVYSKKLVDYLLKFSPSFRTRMYNRHPINPTGRKDNQYPNTKIPQNFLMNTKKIKLFIRYFATCDGGPEFSVYERKDNTCIQLHVGIKIGCDNPIIKKQLYLMLKAIGINANIKKDGISIRKMSEIERFHKLIGFLDESFVRRGILFKGYAKNDVVKLMILCGNITKQKPIWITKNFLSLDEIKKFLLNCIKIINKQQELRKFLNQKLNIKLLHSADISPVPSV